VHLTNGAVLSFSSPFCTESTRSTGEDSPFAHNSCINPLRLVVRLSCAVDVSRHKGEGPSQHSNHRKSSRSSSDPCATRDRYSQDAKPRICRPQKRDPSLLPALLVMCTPSWTATEAELAPVFPASDWHSHRLAVISGHVDVKTRASGTVADRFRWRKDKMLDAPCFCSRTCCSHLCLWDKLSPAVWRNLREARG
jgi:hypothetical protein